MNTPDTMPAITPRHGFDPRDAFSVPPLPAPKIQRTSPARPVNPDDEQPDSEPRSGSRFTSGSPARVEPRVPRRYSCLEIELDQARSEVAQLSQRLQFVERHVSTQQSDFAKESGRLRKQAAVLGQQEVALENRVHF